MTRVEDLDTPAVTVHVDIMERNIRRVQELLDRHGVANRPHIKTHKIPEIGRLQMQGQALGVDARPVAGDELLPGGGVPRLLVQSAQQGDAGGFASRWTDHWSLLGV